MLGQSIDLISLGVLFLLPLDLWLLSYVLEQTSVTKSMDWLHQAWFSLNLTYAYLTIDAATSAVICLSLYYLTFTGVPAAFSPSAWLIRWGGILLVVVFYATQFPAKLVVKLLWPVVKRYNQLPGWIRKHNGVYSAKTLRYLLLPWIEGMRDTAYWVGLCILGGAVIPYLGVLTVMTAFSLFMAALNLSEMAKSILDLLSILSDWGGALIILTLMLNLLFLSFTEE